LEKPKIALKIDMDFRILTDTYFSSTIRVRVIFLFLLIEMHISTITSVVLFRPSQKYSSGNDVFNMTIMYKNIRVENMHTDNLCCWSKVVSRHLLA